MNKINCLIIDDEPLAVLLLESYAKKSQLFNAIFVSTDVEKGIEILKNEIIEITFLDIQMPILNGFDLMTLFKNKNFIENASKKISCGVGLDQIFLLLPCVPKFHIRNFYPNRIVEILQKALSCTHHV